MDPDGDSIGSQLAWGSFLKRFKKQFKIINQGQIPEKYQFLDPQNLIENIDSKNYKDFRPDAVFIFECSYLDRIGRVQKLISPKTPIINIDHHQDNQKFGTINILDKKASAVAETIFDLLKLAKFKITPQTANWLYAAILTDTGRFRFSSTTSKCLRVCAELIDSGADPKLLTDKIYYSVNLSDLRFLGYVLSQMEIEEDGKISSIALKKEILDRYQINTENTEGVVDYSLLLKGVKVGILFKEIAPDRTKVSLRSQNNIDISRIAKAFGGGGHKNAAGCLLRVNMQEAKEIVLKEIKKWI
ncbi:MAG: Phosphoesterase RecJ-like protein [candidate division Zixibacteria bacterium RBG-1]|nr:MAG: Phosphoesterase RecJ-like protein [candidate division Zixibacteria bacterium RBG-1]